MRYGVSTSQLNQSSVLGTVPTPLKPLLILRCEVGIEVNRRVAAALPPPQSFDFFWIGYNVAVALKLEFNPFRVLARTLLEIERVSYIFPHGRTYAPHSCAIRIGLAERWSGIRRKRFEISRDRDHRH